MVVGRNLKWIDISMAEVKLDKLIVHFAQTNKAEGRSNKTISWYSEILEGFTRFLEYKDYKGLLSELDILSMDGLEKGNSNIP